MQVKEVFADTDQEVQLMGTERMVLTDRRSTPPGLAIATADRLGGQSWIVNAANGTIPPITVADRPAALDAMNDIALQVGGADSYSVLEPNLSINGELVPLRQIDNYIAAQQ